MRLLFLLPLLSRYENAKEVKSEIQLGSMPESNSRFSNLKHVKCIFFSFPFVLMEIVSQ